MKTQWRTACYWPIHLWVWCVVKNAVRSYFGCGVQYSIQSSHKEACKTHYIDVFNQYCYKWQPCDSFDSQKDKQRIYMLHKKLTTIIKNVFFKAQSPRLCLTVVFTNKPPFDDIRTNIHKISQFSYGLMSVGALKFLYVNFFFLIRLWTMPSYTQKRKIPEVQVRAAQLKWANLLHLLHLSDMPSIKSQGHSETTLMHCINPTLACRLNMDQLSY